MQRSMHLSLTGIAALILLLAAPATAQTLDEQYNFYLDRYCDAMGFARNSNGTLVAGQAEPNLESFCRVPPAGDGSPTITSQPGAAWPGSVSADGRETAARRRAEAQGEESGADIELAGFANASLFVSLDYRREEQRATRHESGRVTRALGGLLGFDYRTGTRGLLGVAASHGRTSGELDTGGEYKGHNWGGLVFGSWWPMDNVFVDLALGFDRTRLESQRIVSRPVLVTSNPPSPNPPVTTPGYRPAPAPAYSQPRRSDTSGELSAGYDFVLRGFTGGPRLALSLKHSRLDQFSETGATPMTLTFEKRGVDSAQSLAGLQMSLAIPTPLLVLVPQFTADWVHEYRDDQQLIRARFAEDLRPDPSRLGFLNNAPDRDWFVLRTSVAATLIHGFSGFIAAEATIGHALVDRWHASLGLRLEL